MTVTAGREGGLQSLDCHGIIALRINEKNEQMGMIKIGVANNDDKGIQTLQVNRIMGLQSIGVQNVGLTE